MTFLRIFCLLCVFGFSFGCSNKPKPDPRIATEVEESFKQRWIAKRISELTQAGVNDAREARRRATEEFKQKYVYTSAAQKADPVGGGALP